MNATDAENERRAFDRLARSRFSCRAFLPQPVPEETIAHILDTASWAASWSNVQPWEVLVTRPETTARLAQVLAGLAAAKTPAAPDVPFPPGFAGVHLQRRREVGFGLYHALGIAREDRAARDAHHVENFRFFGAPHVALLTVPAAMGAYGALDLGNFLSCFMLAAHAEGLATLAQAALAQYAGAIREMFDIPADRAFLCGVSFGFADPDHPANRFRAPRAAVGETCRFV